MQGVFSFSFRLAASPVSKQEGLNSDHTRWAFFRSRGTREKEIKLYGIDPGMVAKTRVQDKPRPAKPIWVPSQVTPEAKDKATAALRAMKENRRRPIYFTGQRLAQMGLPLYEVESEVKGAVGNERHLQRHVNETIKSLRKEGYK